MKKVFMITDDKVTKRSGYISITRFDWVEREGDWWFEEPKFLAWDVVHRDQEDRYFEPWIELLGILDFNMCVSYKWVSRIVRCWGIRLRRKIENWTMKETR